MVPSTTAFRVGGLEIRQPCRPTFETPKEEQHYNLLRLAGAYRVCALQQLDFGNFTYISIRDSIDPSHLWIKPKAAGNSTLKVSQLQEVDPTGRVVGGNSPGVRLYDQAAWAIHSAIYAARPDVGGIAQCYSPGTRALTMVDGGNIEMILQDSCNFYEQSHVSPLSDLAVVEKKYDATQVAKRLGDGRVLMLANRGGLAIGNSVETALANFVKIENLAKCQLLAVAAAKARGHELATMELSTIEFTAKLLATDQHSWIHSIPPYQDLERDGSLEYLWA